MGSKAKKGSRLSTDNSNIATNATDNNSSETGLKAALTLLIEAQNNNQHSATAGLFNQLKEQFDLFKDVTNRDIFNLHTRVDKLEKEKLELSTRADRLQTENESLVTQLNKMHNEFDELETNSRNSCIIVNNLPEVTGKSHENVFIDMCENNLSLDNSSVNNIKNQIVKIYRLRNNRSGVADDDREQHSRNTSRALLVKFSDDRYKDLVFRKKKHLKGTGIVISEFLTSRRSALLKKCRDKIPGSFTERSIWTDNGRILAKKSGCEIVHIRTENDLDKFIHSYFPLQTSTV